MTVYLGVKLRLGSVTKGSPFIPDTQSLGLNGVFPFPNFATIAANGIEGEVHLNGPDGTAIGAGVTFSVVSLPLATIVPAQLTTAVTAALTVERLWWSCRAIDGSNIRTPLCYGWLQVVPK